MKYQRSILLVALASSLAATSAAQTTLGPPPPCNSGFGTIGVGHTAAWQGTVLNPPLQGDLGENCFQASNGSTTWTWCWALTNDFQSSDGGSIAAVGVNFASFHHVAPGLGTVTFNSEICVAAVVYAAANPGSSAACDTVSSALLASSVLPNPRSLGIALGAAVEVELCELPEVQQDNGGQVQTVSLVAIDQNLFSVHHTTTSSSSAQADREMLGTPECPPGNAYAQAGSAGKILTSVGLN